MSEEISPMEFCERLPRTYTGNMYQDFNPHCKEPHNDVFKRTAAHLSRQVLGLSEYSQVIIERALLSRNDMDIQNAFKKLDLSMNFAKDIFLISVGSLWVYVIEEYHKNLMINDADLEEARHI